MSDRIVKEIEDILDQTYFRKDCKVDSLVRIYDGECSCRGCIYSYTIKCMEEEVNVFR